MINPLNRCEAYEKQSFFKNMRLKFCRYFLLCEETGQDDIKNLEEDVI